ncbi:MAG: hypothetical protein OEZ22_08640 [Spirochaetia bacterium]|nr:hypothetical protein [Spirochaetia bacterium]
MNFFLGILNPVLVSFSIFLSYILIHFPLTSYEPIVNVAPVYFYSFNNNLLSVPDEQLYNAPENIVFDVEYNLNGRQQYKIYKLNKNGLLKESFLIPYEKPVNLPADVNSWPSSSGYITYPYNGSYYIWYPKLGRYVYYFDNDGTFLFEKENTRYLQSFSSGAWVFALAGDHSRLHILKPGLQDVIDTEGMLLIDYETASNKDSKFQFCGAFLDGDIIFMKPKESEKYRIKLKHPVKSISCDLNSGLFLVQIEKHLKSEKKDEKLTDFLLLGKIKDPENLKNDKKPEEEVLSEYTTLYELPLDKSETVTLPLVLNNENFFLTLLSNSQVLIFNEQKTKEISLKEHLANSENIEDWRAFSAEKTIVLWNTSHYYIFQKNGLAYFDKLNNAERAFSSDNFIFFQDSDGIKALKVIKN